MKRLVRKSSQLDEIKKNPIDIDTSNMNGMMGVNELDEADIRHDRCTVCKNAPLRKQDGFKKCTRCGAVYKVLDGDSYIISNEDHSESKEKGKEGV